MKTQKPPEARATGSVPRSPSYVGGNAEHASHVRSCGTFLVFPEQDTTDHDAPATWLVRTANEMCRNVACAREWLWRALLGAHRRWSQSVTRADQDAPTLRPQAVNAQVEDASADNGSEVELRAEWAQLAADWGIGGWINQADEILKRNPAAAPPGAIEAGWRLLDLIEWAGIDSRHLLASDVWRAEP